MKKIKKIYYSDEARQGLVNGINQVAQAVSATLGPRGRLVLLSRPNSPGGAIATKDGVTVAKEIKLSDPLEEEGAKYCIEVAMKSNNLVGDGPQPLYSKVLTPNGFVEMGSLKIGDKICGTNGTTQYITGVFPKGKKQIYKIKFAGGQVVECCEDHLWNVTTSYGKNKTLPVSSLLEGHRVVTVKNDHKQTHYYSPISHADFNSGSFPLDPYLVGLLIGDGSLSGSGSIELSLGPNDKDVVESLEQYIPEGMWLNTNYVEYRHYYRVKINGKTESGKSMFDLVKETGLFGTKSGTKFIPKEYLYSDLKSRKELLRGLTDTDGHINKKGLLEYSTISEQLSKDVVELLRGLGKTVSVWLKKRSGDSYSSTPIYVINELVGYKYGTAISEIECTDDYTEMQCIKVSNEDSLYFTDDYILTHNTSSSVVLANSLVNEGLKYVGSGGNSNQVKVGMDLAVNTVLTHLQNIKTDVTTEAEIENVATISGNSTEIGKFVAQAFVAVGKDGVVTYEPTRKTETELDLVKGLKIDRGMWNPYFATDSVKRKAELTDAYVLLWGDRISNLQDLSDFMNNYLIKYKEKPLLIVSDDIEQDSMATIVLNKMKGAINVCCIKAPGIGSRREDLMNDLSVLVGAKYWAPDMGSKLKNVNMESLGRAKTIHVSMEDTVFIDGGVDQQEFDSHIAGLKQQFADTDSPHDKNRITERIAKLSGTVAVIKIGAVTESELIEKRYRFEDAISATKAAMEEGIVPGGGSALLSSLPSLSALLATQTDTDIQAGVKFVMKALQAPTIIIANNGGFIGAAVVEKVIEIQQAAGLDPRLGFNAKTGIYENLIQAGVIDPVKVTRSALENAASIAGIVLMTESVIVDDPDFADPAMSQFSGMM